MLRPDGKKERLEIHRQAWYEGAVILLPIGFAGILLAFGFKTETLAGGLLLWSVLCLTVDFLAACSANWMLRHRLRVAASGSS